MNYLKLSTKIASLLVALCFFVSDVPAWAGVIDVDDDIAENGGERQLSEHEKAKQAKKKKAPKVEINFAFETSDPIPFALPVITKETEKIYWSNLNHGGVKFLDGGNFSFGGQFLDGYTELAAQLGFRIVKGSFLAGSVDKNGAALSDYKAFFVPVRFYARFAPFKWKVRPYAGLFVGLNIGQLTYTSPKINDTIEVIAQFDAGLRAGVDFNIVRGFGVGLYFEGELSTNQHIAGAHDLSMSGMRAGLSIFYHFRKNLTELAQAELENEQQPVSLQNMKEQEEREAEQARIAAEKLKKAEETRMTEAFDEIKKGDSMKFDHRCDIAIGHYRKGLSILPKNPEVDRNIGVPVRLDLASCLIELDKIKEATKVLQEANRIDQGNVQVINALEAVGVEVQAAPERQPVPKAEEGLVPVEPLDGVIPLD